MSADHPIPFAQRLTLDAGRTFDCGEYGRVYLSIPRDPASGERGMQPWQADRLSHAIVQAWNAHDPLLAALQACWEYMDLIPESAAGGDDEAVRLARIAKEAIIKARTV